MHCFKGEHVLPDLPKLKADISHLFDMYQINRINAYLGFVNEIPQSIIKEGKNPTILRGDSSRDEIEIKQASATATFKRDEIPSLSMQERMKRLDAAAKEIAAEISTIAFAAINEAVDRIGNVVDANGKPLSPEAIFEVLEKIHLDFDENGNPEELNIVVSPDLSERFVETMQQLQNDPELKKRYDAIINTKRKEWHDREIARKLVG
jgi:hypothetical protein